MRIKGDKLSTYLTVSHMQAYLRYMAGSVPDYNSKANVTIKQVIYLFFLLVEDLAFSL